MNEGKRFEQDFQSSVPDYALIYRLRDPAQSFGKNNNLRFSARNPFDYLMWDSMNRNLYALELKSIKGNSISFERSKDDRGDIHYYQIEGLNHWNKYPGIICGFVIEFRSFEKTIFLSIIEFNRLSNIIQKKSITLNDLEIYRIQYTIIPSRLVRTHFRYDLNSFIEQTKSNKNA